MRFSHIEVTNFRSFGSEATRIDFPDEENLVGVVGANNAGKSNLLEALRLVLGGRRRWEPTPSEFHRLDVTTELRIELHLREPLLRGDVFGRENAVRAFYFRAWQSTRAPDKGQLKHEHRCLDNSGKIYNPPVAVKGSGSATPGAQALRRVPPPAREVLPQLGPVHYLDPQMYRAFDTMGLVSSHGSLTCTATISGPLRTPTATRTRRATNSRCRAPTPSTRRSAAYATSSRRRSSPR